LYFITSIVPCKVLLFHRIIALLWILNLFADALLLLEPFIVLASLLIETRVKA
jgi:hypothetical protein